MKNICQSCGTRLNDDNDKGSNKDLSKNEEYCMYCFDRGEFIEENLKFEKQLEKAVNLLMMKLGLTEKNAIIKARSSLLTLKRWKK